MYPIYTSVLSIETTQKDHLKTGFFIPPRFNKLIKSYLASSPFPTALKSIFSSLPLGSLCTGSDLCLSMGSLYPYSWETATVVGNCTKWLLPPLDRKAPSYLVP